MPLTQNSLPSARRCRRWRWAGARRSRASPASSRMSGDLPCLGGLGSDRPRATIPPGAARLRAFHAEAETTSVARDLGATSETASKGARWLASSPHHTRGRYLGIRGPAEKEGPVRACVAALPRWSGWLYAHQTLWLDPGPDWDEEKVAEFLAMCASTWCARHPADRDPGGRAPRGARHPDGGRRGHARGRPRLLPGRQRRLADPPRAPGYLSGCGPARAGSRRTRPFHARGSAAHPGSAGWHAPPLRRPASRTPVRSPRHGSSGPPPPSPGP